MPYTNGNINFVLESDFKPFSLQEMLMPFTAYKEEFEKAENAYQELSEKSDKFKYLSKQLPEGSEARQIYEGYANDLSTQAEDIARNGLSMRNRRALTSLKRRYTGEIGRLDIAQTALEKEKEMRRARGLQDSSMLYAVDNMTVDDFLDGKNPNLYGVSGNELYTRGAAAGKAASMRVFSAGDAGKTLGGYYRDYVERMGYNADTIAKFRADISTIPELQQAAEAILQERGVSQNLSGANYERAKQSVINGIIDGAVYQEQHKPMQDLGVMTAAQVAADARQREAHALAREQFNFEKTKYNDAKAKQDQLDKLMYTYDDKGNITGYNTDTLGQLQGNGKDYVYNPVTQRLEKRTMTPEEAAAAEQAKADAKKQLENAQKVKGARTLKEIDAAGYVPIFATIHPSKGSSKGLSIEEARKTNNYKNVEGWRSGRSGQDVPDLWSDWTDTPLVKGVGSRWMPSLMSLSGTGDFAYGENELKNKPTKMLSDQEYATLIQRNPAIEVSINAQLEEQGYPENTPFEVLEVAGKGDKRSYVICVPKDIQILQGE